MFEKYRIDMGAPSCEFLQIVGPEGQFIVFYAKSDLQQAEMTKKLLNEAFRAGHDWAMDQ